MSAQPQHLGYSLTPRVIHGWRLRWLRGSVAVSQSDVFHQYQLRETRGHLVRRRYGITLKLFGWSVATYIERRVSHLTNPDVAWKTTYALAVDTSDRTPEPRTP